MRTNRREAMGILVTAGAAWAAGSENVIDFKKLAAAPKSAEDHRLLAKHYRAVAAEHEGMAKEYEVRAAQYKNGLPGVTEGHAHELSRALRHAAEHARDFAEALTDVAEVHEGIAQGPV